MSTVSTEQMNRILYAYHHDPFEVLGMHTVQRDGSAAMAIRAFRPEAQRVYVIRTDTDERIPLERVQEHGFFEAVVDETERFPYELELQLYNGDVRREQDPYRFGPVLSDFDLQLLGEGNHHHSYDKLGAHLIEHEGTEGTLFAVWAPNAQRVSVVGNFNGWDGRRHAMRVRGGSGIWELFMPGLGEGELYKYQILGPHGEKLEKADPYAFASELRPNTASKVWNLERFEWSDEEWLRQRTQSNWFQEPVNIYEVHLPSWARSPDNPDQYLDYRTLAHMLVRYVKHMGYTHIELLPITEYPYDGSWGYQVVGYFAPTSRLGTPDDFKYFVNYCHEHGIGVLMDWVPAHFPKDVHGLARFDGTALYEYADPRLGEHRDWGTYIFNYGRNEVRNFLLSSALFWLGEYHIDGLRVDAVASILYLDYSREPGQWVPNQYGGRENLEAIDFLRRMNELSHHYHPGVMMIAEESTSFPLVTRPTYLGGLGFDFKWNMGWMNDSLEYIKKDPIHRKYEHNKLTFGLMYAFSENFILPISHDEVVHLKGSLAEKMPGDHWQEMANLRLYLGFMFTHPGKKLLFQGQDIGQWNEFNENRSTDWHLMEWEPHRGVNQWMRDLLHLVNREPALHELDHSWEGFQWIDVNDWENSIISYIRYAKDKNDFVVIIHNFTPVVRQAYHIGVPAGGPYRELLNSDAEMYWGSNAGNGGQVEATDEPWMGFEHSLLLTLPPLATLVLKPLRESGNSEEARSDEVPSHEGPGAVDHPTRPAENPGWVRNLQLSGEQGETAEGTIAEASETSPTPPMGSDTAPTGVESAAVLEEAEEGEPVEGDASPRTDKPNLLNKLRGETAAEADDEQSGTT